MGGLVAGWGLTLACEYGGRESLDYHLHHRGQHGCVGRVSVRLEQLEYDWQ